MTETTDDEEDEDQKWSEISLTEKTLSIACVWLGRLGVVFCRFIFYLLIQMRVIRIGIQNFSQLFFYFFNWYIY